ncbi:MAG: phosphatidylinositol-specific phospholipase C/glycerophosphodiester phosphodiesterase family protein [Fimbriimonadales bacterium]|nr:phosphatidylinositol-specific phospholipase C/glycerophosphodiester phosphodiesterase family protein [Fimbriimonadales bacterium]
MRSPKTPPQNSQPNGEVPRSARNDSGWLSRKISSFRVERGTSNALLSETVLPRAHSHNDYWRKRPLQDALECGFCSVEADIFLVEGKLLVGHDLHELRPDRTLESLYLDPLRARAKQFRGKIYPDAPHFYLLIDVKSDAQTTYTALRKALERYQDLFTHYEGERRIERAVQAVLSGNRVPVEQLQRERVRLVGYDGRLSDLEGNTSPTLMPWVSDNWMRLFRWNGRGALPEEEHTKLRQLVQKAHAKGYKLRFWATADVPPVWEALWDAGVDLIGTDTPYALRDFMWGKLKASGR